MCLLNSKNGFCLECVILWLVSGIHRINNAKVRVEAFSLPGLDIKLEKNVRPSSINQCLFPSIKVEKRKIAIFSFMLSNYNF